MRRLSSSALSWKKPAPSVIVTPSLKRTVGRPTSAALRSGGRRKGVALGGGRAGVPPWVPGPRRGGRASTRKVGGAGGGGGPRLEQAYRDRRILRQPSRQDAARRTTADDDIVVI